MRGCGILIRVNLSDPDSTYAEYRYGEIGRMPRSQQSSRGCSFRALGSCVLGEFGTRNVSYASAVESGAPIGWRGRRTRSRENSIVRAAVSFGCLSGAPGPMQRPAVSGLRAEYSRRRSSTLDPDTLGKWERIRRLREPSTLGGDRALSIPVSRRWFGTNESRVRSAEIEHSRSRFLGSGFQRVEYARRRLSTFCPDISRSSEYAGR